MRPSRLLIRSLTYHARTNVAVVLGAAVGTSALLGAMIVGDSMRESLRRAALDRLGRVDAALVAQRFFREALSETLTSELAGADKRLQVVPAIFLDAGGAHAETGARAEGVSLLGVDQRFWRLNHDGSAPRGAFAAAAEDRTIILNEPLATELRAKVGDDVLIRTGKPSAISTETLLGRRDETTVTLRVTVAGIVPAEGLAAFSVHPRQTLSKNAFVPLKTLQRAIQQPERVNGLLVGPIPIEVDEEGRSTPSPYPLPQGGEGLLGASLRRRMTLADLGLSLRRNEALGYVALEAESMLIDPVVEEAAMVAAAEVGATASGVLTHLANTISVTSAGGSSAPQGAASRTVIPYSTIAAVGETLAVELPLSAGHAPRTDDEMALNEWAAADLNAKLGDTISINFYVSGPMGRIETREAVFRLGGIVALSGWAADPGLIPEYKGVTDAKTLADWNPPFPFDLARIRDQDEKYWDTNRTTPKAFLALAAGQRLWVQDESRFGRLTSIRFRLNESSTSDRPAAGTPTIDALERALLTRLDPAKLGLAFDPLRRRALAASQGATDFAGLFLGFSFFLIVSAAMLVALMFRLSIERRSFEVGLLLAVGHTPIRVSRRLVTEGLLLAIVGGCIGAAGAVGYAWLMLAGLRSWWAEAVQAPFLRLFVNPSTILVGVAAGVILAGGAAAWSVRGLSRRPPRALLQGNVLVQEFGPRRAGRWIGSSIVLLLVAAATAAASVAYGSPSPVVAFFIAGVLTLLACLAGFSAWCRRDTAATIRHPGFTAMLRLAARNIPRHLGRSRLTVALIASATFLIVALSAFRLDARDAAGDRNSPTGGFRLFAQSAAPLPYDLNAPAGRDALNLSTSLPDASQGLHVAAFRLRPGGESSCRNLYAPTRPRVLGVDDAFIDRGGFPFSSSIATTPADQENPWRLLRMAFDDGAIPAVADEAAVRWQMHLGLGQDLAVQDDRGREVRLRFVALLKGSALQDEILVADRHFTRLFPGIDGHGFFLMECPEALAASVTAELESRLAVFGFDVASLRDRLAAYQAVQNTYLSTFQALGGLGLILGTIGLAAVLLRNVWERRREIALLRATGYSLFLLGGLIVAENFFLVLVGAFAGLLAAGVAVGPAIAADPAAIPCRSLVVTLAPILFTALGTCILGAATGLRAPLLRALQSE
ncbi:MAG: ABC transporter permease [Planctomycetota bacterium]